MYNPQEMANRVKTIVKQQGKSVNEVLIACELGRNTVSKMANGGDIYSKNLVKIADYLDISVDYLLGRTDKQATTYNNDNSVIQGNSSVAVTGSSSISGSIFGSGSISTTVPTNESKEPSKELSKEETEILNTYRLLNARDRTKFMNFVFEMEDKIEKA